jgi:hypothetical protein
MLTKFALRIRGSSIQATFTLYSAANGEGEHFGLLIINLPGEEEEQIDQFSAWSFTALLERAKRKAGAWLKDELEVEEETIEQEFPL